MGTQDLLMRAHELAGEFDIARGNYHVDEDGESCLPQRAVAHCTVGFMYRAAEELRLGETFVEEAIYAAHEALNLQKLQLTYWNDNMATDDDVRALFRRLAGAPEKIEQPVTQEVLALV